MYAMCAGRPPFRAETAIVVLRRICEETPRPIREINTEIPDWLEEIVENLHEKDPRNRFQTAAEVAELLGRHLAHLQQPTTVPKPPRLSGRRRTASARRSSKPPWRRPVAVATLLSIVGAGLLGVCYLSGLFSAAPDLSTVGQRKQSDGESPERSSLAPATIAGQWNLGLNEQQWDAEAGLLREVTKDIESGWHQISDVQPVETRSESIAELKRRLDELQREYADEDL
jgi:serine/threonine protein kinase